MGGLVYLVQVTYGESESTHRSRRWCRQRLNRHIQRLLRGALWEESVRGLECEDALFGADARVVVLFEFEGHLPLAAYYKKC